eukprot:364513-Chlamydomonas_euryale.AAC.14
MMQGPAWIALRPWHCPSILALPLPGTSASKPTASVTKGAVVVVACEVTPLHPRVTCPSASLPNLPFSFHAHLPFCFHAQPALQLPRVTCPSASSSNLPFSFLAQPALLLPCPTCPSASLPNLPFSFLAQPALLLPCPTCPSASLPNVPCCFLAQPALLLPCPTCPSASLPNLPFSFLSKPALLLPRPTCSAPPHTNKPSSQQTSRLDAAPRRWPRSRSGYSPRPFPPHTKINSKRPPHLASGVDAVERRAAGRVPEADAPVGGAAARRQQAVLMWRPRDRLDRRDVVGEAVQRRRARRPAPHKQVVVVAAGRQAAAIGRPLETAHLTAVAGLLADVGVGHAHVAVQDGSVAAAAAEQAAAP